MANAIKKKKPNNSWSGYIVYLLAVVLVLMIIMYIMKSSKQVVPISYNQMIQLIQQGKVTNAQFEPAGGDYNENILAVELKSTDPDVTYTINILDWQFDDINALILAYNTTAENDIVINTIPAKSYGGLLTLLSLIFPFLLIGIFAFFFLRNSGGNNKAFDFAKSRAKLNKSKEVTFDDVAGQEEEKEELVEIVDFLKNPKKYNDLGARIPKGVLLSGPPGTGKTLLAKGCAGEANVPFYSISGSDFVEMFVGVGASRVRDMFKTAKQNAPCIIFIDEIDAVGRQRGSGIGGGHDEREQTLNQLLAEMDGFGANTGVIVMAATNRPDVLDPALLRPGRFDRHIIVSNPDVKGREEILKVHARNKKFAPSVRLSEVAKRTPGFSGADLENLLNESALLAARGNRKLIEMQDLDEAMDRVLMGPAKKSRKYSHKDKLIVAHHEAGHAVIGLKLENAEIVHKVTIVPRGQAGGYALMLPEEERFVATKQDLLDQITGLLGGRVSEEINFNEITTGAHNDFEKATKIARSMVTEYGMSKLGPVQYEQNTGSVFLGRDYMKERNFSSQIALEIDNEVRRIIDECYERARTTLQANLDLVKLIANQLMEMETLTREDIEELVATGKVKWWDEKKITDQQEAEKAMEKEIKPEDKVIQ
ncbi:MAG: cell division protein FtsH [Haloplasmataceae bacterium]|jgi:cell division protease FtsH|nr:cell division protein FtsH [Haloplasmataceae bacterium]